MRRREESLLVTRLRDETVVYDLQRHRAHCLNATAALVWSYCDGETSVREMTRRLSADLGVVVREEWVWRALGQLERAHLLEGAVEPPRGARLSRRDLLRMSRVAVGLLPVVASLLAPTPAVAAFTCKPPNCIPSNGCRPGLDTCKCCAPPNCAKKCDARGVCSNAVSGC